MNHINKFMLANVLHVINIIGANLYNINVAKNVEDSRTKMYNRSTKTICSVNNRKNVPRDMISLP